jgi:hypothetical protein
MMEIAYFPLARSAERFSGHFRPDCLYYLWTVFTGEIACGTAKRRVLGQRLWPVSYDEAHAL